MINVTVWNEYFHEREEESAARVYPRGIHKCIADFLDKEDDINVRCATLYEENCGLSDSVLENTDVLIWWGHMKHESVPDELVAKIHNRVLRGMGLIVLHSGHLSKIFKSLMGTSCCLLCRDGDRERVWCINPNHPITKNVPMQFELEVEEMYGEFFDIPTPDELIFMGWFSGGEVFRSGCVWKRGYGKIFYFQPGHETNPTYHNENVQTIIKNAVRYLNPNVIIDEIDCRFFESLETNRK